MIVIHADAGSELIADAVKCRQRILADLLCRHTMIDILIYPDLTLQITDRTVLENTTRKFLRLRQIPLRSVYREAGENIIPNPGNQPVLQRNGVEIPAHRPEHTIAHLRAVLLIHQAKMFNIDYRKIKLFLRILQKQILHSAKHRFSCKQPRHTVELHLGQLHGPFPHANQILHPDKQKLRAYRLSHKINCAKLQTLNLHLCRDNRV